MHSVENHDTLSSMKKIKKSKAEEVVHEEKYVAFLRKRLDSENFVKNSTKEEINKTEAKLDKAKFRLRLLKESMK